MKSNYIGNSKNHSAVSELNNYAILNMAQIDSRAKFNTMTNFQLSEGLERPLYHKTGGFRIFFLRPRIGLADLNPLKLMFCRIDQHFICYLALLKKPNTVLSLFITNRVIQFEDFFISLVCAYGRIIMLQGRIAFLTRVLLRWWQQQQFVIRFLDFSCDLSTTM